MIPYQPTQSGLLAAPLKHYQGVKPMEFTRKSFKAHPWHGVAIGPDCPQKVTAYIEIIPTDVVKYEIDKESGYLKIDRPQKYSNYCPALYGFIPQTYCGEHVGTYCAKEAQRAISYGDRDPLDICVLTEKSIQHNFKPIPMDVVEAHPTKPIYIFFLMLHLIYTYREQLKHLLLFLQVL